MNIEEDAFVIDEFDDSEVTQKDSDWVATFKSMSTTAVVLGATLIILSISHIVQI